MKLILMGATGFTGGEVLKQALADPEIEKVMVATRRLVALTHPKLTQVIIRDFLDYSSLDFSEYDACIWCLGVSQIQVSASQYIRITHDYAVAAATAMFASNPHLRFCFVSGRSADPSEQRSSLQSRIKGRAERSLSALGGRLYIFRPGYIRPSKRTGPRQDIARFLAPIGSAMALFNSDFAVDCDHLAYCLLSVAKHGAPQTLLSNSLIREYVSQDGKEGVSISLAKVHSQTKNMPNRRYRWPAAAAITAIAILLCGIFLASFAALGERPQGDRLKSTKQSPQWQGDQFHNPQPIWTNLTGAWKRFLFERSPPETEPEETIAVVKTDRTLLARPPETGLRATWFGHSSSLVQIDGVNILTDPIWSERASPVSWAGPKRSFAPPIELSNLPPIDAVVISHDHYDHFDYETVKALASRQSRFIVPLGMGSHLAHWGIPEKQIVELDWWQSTSIGNVKVTATPARHKSGRFFTQANKTLWAGYAMAGPKHRVWYSGDSGFHNGLSRIGQELGPFDLTLIESGQHDHDWPDTHLGPELAVKAHHLVRGQRMVPVHWALFKLANHSWTEPIEGVLKAAKCSGISVLTPRPGESFEPILFSTSQRWWPDVKQLSSSEEPILPTESGSPTRRMAIPTCPNRSPGNSAAGLDHSHSLNSFDSTI